ncbi:hypothetical protein KUTeg_013161 [Tegillarca granosa]|uniref:OTU domain-containing protein n=1 Tax=Tegillarca granosa TaxID=220873 RepID=A0ABQ9ESW5_TEGGR|nr:hypothetical protein KUTeg_013161 [Tegillarca granosa]
MRWNIHVYILVSMAYLSVGDITNLKTIDKCQAEHSTQSWDVRAQQFCPDDKLYYHCLEDESTGKIFYEFCSPRARIDKGYYPTFNINTRTIVPKVCPSGQFQPLQDKWSHLFNRCDNKRLCDDTGQMVCEESDATQDRLCMCKYKDGYVRIDYYGQNPNRTEICCPENNLCKCSIPDNQCKNGFELNAASQCVKVCPEGSYRPEKTLDCVKKTDMVTMSKQSSPLTNSTSTTLTSSTLPNNIAKGDGDRQSSDKTDLYITLGVAIGPVFIFCNFLLFLVRRGVCTCIKKVYNWHYIHQAQNVQCGENSTAQFIGNGNRKSTSEASDGDSCGSSFKGFQRKSQQHECSSTESVPVAVHNAHEKSPNPTPTSTLNNETSNKTYIKNFKALEQAASKKGFKVQDVPGDGNCMYNSVLLQLKPDHQMLTVDEMRKNVQKFIESNPSTPSDEPYKNLLSALEWKPGCNSKQHNEYEKLQNNNLEESEKKELLFQIYLNEVRENEWGDPFTLLALSQIYNVEIEVLSSRNLSDFTKTSVKLNNPSKTIHLGHLAVNGEDLHYVALLPNDEGGSDQEEHDANNRRNTKHSLNHNVVGIKNDSDQINNAANINDIKLEVINADPEAKQEGKHTQPQVKQANNGILPQVKSEANLSEEKEVTNPLLPK